MSNTDIGTELVELITASTMYKANTRVVTTSQEMFDELMRMM
jgi:flagellar hook protein FlgE